ncbi:hypothetical protein ACT691_10265 [Vibrio metschnikovii]
MLAVAGFYAYQTTQLDQQVALAQQQTDRLNQQLAELQQQQAKHRPSAGKVAAIERIKRQIAGQQASLSAMDQFTTQPARRLLRNHERVSERRSS